MLNVRASAITVILIVVVGLLPCANAQTSGGEVLTLDVAIQLARSNNRELKQSGLDLDRQREVFRRGKDAFVSSGR